MSAAVFNCGICGKPIEKERPDWNWVHIEDEDAVRCPSKNDYPTPKATHDS